MPNASILIIEDEADLATLYEYHLKGLGYRVLSAATGKEGLKAFRRGRFDAVVLDLMLPDMHGLECFRHLRRASRVPVLFLSARKEAAGLRFRGNGGPAHCLLKPCSLSALGDRLRAMTAGAAR